MSLVRRLRRRIASWKWVCAFGGAVIGASLTVSDAGADTTAAPPPDGELGALREGDVLLQASLSAQSRAIQIVTGSPFSHVGLVHREGGRLLVFEAVGPVKLTPLAEWIARGEGRRFLALRLRDADQRLTPEVLAKVARVEARFRGLPYDFAFGWSDERMYCSELVWKVYKEGVGVELARLQRLGDFDLTDPIVRAKVRERYGAHVPVDEPVISPAAIAASPLLETIVDRFH
jgi:hypothetical protein